MPIPRMPTSNMRKPAIPTCIKDDSVQMQPLRAWLLEHKARQLWSTTDVPGIKDIEITCYIVGSKLLLLWYWLDTGGWDVYVPADTSGQTSATLEALDAYVNGNQDDTDLDGKAEADERDAKSGH